MLRVARRRRRLQRLPVTTCASTTQFDEKLDSKYEYHGVTVVVDKKSALYLDGTTVDFYDGLEKRGFTFDNPNAVKTLRLRQLVPGVAWAR